MTERLYLSDSYLTRFHTRVLRTLQFKGRLAVVLSQTAFYPEGGGQPGDRGTLGAVSVLDTQERDGEVLHLLDAPTWAAEEADGVVDWPRRFDHIQQHHGQHLLSAAFQRVHGVATVSFHLGEKTCTIDLDCSIDRLNAAALRAAEAAANESVWQNHPVIARDFTGEERVRLTLRKEPVKGDRVILVEGVDASPCGGTHPRRTGEVGCIQSSARSAGAPKRRVLNSSAEAAWFERSVKPRSRSRGLPKLCASLHRKSRRRPLAWEQTRRLGARQSRRWRRSSLRKRRNN